MSQQQTVEHRVARNNAGFYCLDCAWRARAGDVRHNLAVMRAHGVCQRRQCRGRVPHSWGVHWFGWLRR